MRKALFSIVITAIVLSFSVLPTHAAEPVTPLDPNLVMYANDFTVGEILAVNLDPYLPDSQVSRLNPTNALGPFDATAPSGVSDFFFATGARTWSHFTFADRFMNVDGAPDIEFAEVTWGSGTSWHTEAIKVYLTGTYVKDANGKIVPYNAADDGIGYYAGVAWNRIGLENVLEATRLSVTEGYFSGIRDFADNDFYRSGDYGTFTQFHLPDEVVFAEGIYLVDITKDVYGLGGNASFIDVNGTGALVTLNSDAWDVINYTKIMKTDVIAINGTNGNTDGYDLDAIRVYKYNPGSLEVSLDVMAQDFHNEMKQDYYNVLKQDYHNVLKQDYHNELKQDFHNVLKQDFHNVLKQDFHNVLKQDFHNVLKQDFHNELKQDYHNELKQDFHNVLKQDYHNVLKQDFHNVLKQDFHNVLKQDFHNVLKQDFHEVFVPVFEKDVSYGYGTLVTRLEYSGTNAKAVPTNGGVFKNGHTYVNVNVAAASAEGGVWYTIADSSFNSSGKKTPDQYNRPLLANDGTLYQYNVKIEDGKLTITFDDRLVSASVGAYVVGNIKNFPGNAPKHYDDTVTVDVPSNNGTVYLYFHLEGIAWYTTGEYEFVRWDFLEKVLDDDPYFFEKILDGNPYFFQKVLDKDPYFFEKILDGNPYFFQKVLDKDPYFFEKILDGNPYFFQKLLDGNPYFFEKILDGNPYFFQKVLDGNPYFFEKILDNDPYFFQKLLDGNPYFFQKILDGDPYFFQKVLDGNPYFFEKILDNDPYFFQKVLVGDPYFFQKILDGTRYSVNEFPGVYTITLMKGAVEIDTAVLTKDNKSKLFSNLESGDYTVILTLGTTEIGRKDVTVYLGQKATATLKDTIDGVKGADVIIDGTKGADVIIDGIKGADVIIDGIKGADVIIDGTKGKDVIIDGIQGKDVIIDGTKGADVIIDGIKGADVIIDGIQGKDVIIDGIKGADVIIDGIKGADVIMDGIQGKDVIIDGIQGADVIMDGIQGADAIIDGEQGPDVIIDGAQGPDVHLGCDEITGDPQIDCHFCDECKDAGGIALN